MTKSADIGAPLKGQQTSNEILDIPLKEILMDEGLNCRGAIAPIDVQDLVRDISNNGLLSPVIVQRHSGDHFGKKYKYRLIAGFRRFTCHKILNWATIRATVTTSADECDARLINLRENLLRKDLNIMEEAKAVEHLSSFKLTYQQIANELGKSTTWVQMRIKLLELPHEIQQQAAAGVLTQYNIRDISKLPTKEMQFEAVRQIKNAKEKGNRAPIIKKKHSENSLIKRHRKRNEIFCMMDHIQKSIGNNFGTRCLAWASGEISDNSVYQEIRAQAAKLGRPYIVPHESVSSMSGMESV